LNFDAIVSSIERDLLLQSLEKAGGNKMRAAKLLHMKRTTFIEKLKRLQINTETENIVEDDSENEDKYSE
jgi:DNA-binding NtrC family response regulator